MTVPPAPPVTFDFSGGLRRWGYLGNDVVGDCVPAALEHLRMAKAIAATSTWQHPLFHLGFRPPGAPYTRLLYAQYLATQGQRPGPNTGVFPGPYLDWLRAHQPRPLIIAWAPVPLDYDADLSLRQHAAQFTGCLVQFCLTPRAYDLSTTRQPWAIGGTTSFDQPNPNLEHEVALVRATTDFEVVVTWGQNKSATRDFVNTCTVGAQVVLMEEDTWRPDFPEKLAALLAMPGANTQFPPATT
jgi:hypothetical protein